MALDLCSAPLVYVARAQQMVHTSSSPLAICAVATLLERHSVCSSVPMCTFYWVFIALLFGFTPEDSPAEIKGRAGAWDTFFQNTTMQMWRIHGRNMRNLATKRLNLYGHPKGPTQGSIGRSSKLLLYADSERYFSAWHVAPFVHQLRCYTEAHGIQFALDSKGPRVPHTDLYVFNRSIDGEFYISLREHEQSQVVPARALIQDLFRNRRLERAAELINLEGTLAINYAQSFQFGRIWALAEHLSALEPGALLIFFDADVTLRPDSWHENLAELLLQQQVPDGNPAHIFIADTWFGTECVNSGFFAVRNTPIGHLFLELWKEKLWWASSWDQAALAETVLEILGAEAWKLHGGRKTYDMRCLNRLLPISDGTYTYTRYCDCWHSTLRDLVGEYRLRKSTIVSFVDPERLEINYIPNNLFWDHNYELTRMCLAPSPSRPVFTPMVIHWAGMGERRFNLMQKFVLPFGINVSDDTCPSIPVRSIDGNVKQAGFSLGSQARQLRCCEQLLKHEDKRKFPWNLPNDEWVSWVSWWGCNDWKAVTMELCNELSGHSAATEQQRSGAD